MSESTIDLSLFEETAPRDDRMWCRWIAWIAVSADTLMLRLPEMNSCDMNRTIAIAQHLLPAVRSIHVYMGGVLDIIYQRNDDGAWEANDVRGVCQEVARRERLGLPPLTFRNPETRKTDA